MGLCKYLVVISLVGAVVLAVLIHQYINREIKVPDISKPGYWGSSAMKSPAGDTSVRPFKIRVEIEVLKDLQSRLANTRYQPELEDANFEYGFQVGYMREIVSYWRDGFDWRKQERLLNAFNHYKTHIEGLDVHFIHAKPSAPKGPVYPILMVHGWPGSFFEFYKVIPLLTDTTGDFAFEVIVPSIPGFGFSDSPKQTGFDPTDAARVFRTLMLRLGHDKFYIQGGDFGGVIVHIMSIAFPENILGHHNNFIHCTFIMAAPFKTLIGSVFPSLVLAPNESRSFYPLADAVKMTIKESGYHLIQATRPDSVGMALTDSPVGLAAYILEKFCQNWQKINAKQELTCDLTQFYTLDEVLTNLMIYWVNGNFVSSARFYKEHYRSPVSSDFGGLPSYVPTGIADFPGEAVRGPRSFMEPVFPDLIQWTEMETGGHFAALEQPKLLADDVIRFVRKTIALKKK